MIPLVSRSVTRALTKSFANNSCHLSTTRIANLRTPRTDLSTPSRLAAFQNSEILPDSTTADSAETKEIWSKINEQIETDSYGRLFVVVGVDKHQHKVTSGDLLMVNHDLGAKNGQRIRLEKILLVGAKDFTLFGRPFLPRDLVNVEATVVEKSLSHKKINFYARGKRDVKYCTFDRDTTTTLRINKIDLLKPIDDTSDRMGFEPGKNLYGPEFE